MFIFIYCYFIFDFSGNRLLGFSSDAKSGKLFEYPIQKNYKRFTNKKRWRNVRSKNFKFWLEISRILPRSWSPLKRLVRWTLRDSISNSSSILESSTDLWPSRVTIPNFPRPLTLIPPEKKKPRKRNQELMQNNIRIWWS